MDFYLTTSASTLPRFQITWISLSFSSNVSSDGEGTNSAATHATLHPTYSPFWDELLVIKVPKENFSKQGRLS